ncbi:MAG: TolB family protein, partial [Dehalococcoidia bacterium]
MTVPLVLLFVGLLAVACGNSDSASDSEIIYSSVIDGSHDVFKVSRDELGVTQLTGSAGTNTNPSWAPDKSQIAFLSDRNGPNALWVMDWAGESKRQISSPGTEIAAFEWAPDSVTVAVEIIEDETHWIATINTESGDVDPLTMQSE